MASDKSPKPFAEKVNVYGPMGAVINEASRVEFSLDKLNFQLLKSFEDRAVAISKKFPLKIDEKIDFFSKSFRLFPIVRTEPFWGDGETNLESICYSALELFDARNHLAHGAIDFIDSNSAGPIYTARKFSHAGAKNTYFLHEYSISS